MRTAKEWIGKSVISITDGQNLGTIKDLYFDPELRQVTAVFLGSEGLIRRKSLLIKREDVAVWGIDVLLVKNSQVVVDDKAVTETSAWLRFDKFRGRAVDTPGGTKVGAVGDVLLTKDSAIVLGVKLGKVLIEGPIAEKEMILRETIFDIGNEDNALTIDLARAESQTSRMGEDG